MPIIHYIDRRTKEKKQEAVYGGKFIRFFYGEKWYSKWLFTLVIKPIVAAPLFSSFYGFLQKMPSSRGKIKDFIEKYEVDSSEFLKSVEAFTSFNDFFIRQLKKQARPIIPDAEIAILPADARYLAYSNIDECDGFLVKGKKFTVEELIQDKELSKRYEGGSMVIARLAPMDYHRFHFPMDAVPTKPRLINGKLFSVNTLALRKNIKFLCENKRMLTVLKSQAFGEVLFLEVGATNVGTIVNTFTPGKIHAKGEEKGYFSFGGSCVILLFQKGCILLDEDLLEATRNRIETRGLMGQSLGRPSKATV